MEVYSNDDEEFQLGMNLIDNEEFQNANSMHNMGGRLYQGSAIDAFKDDETFGLTFDNPVPVNGQYGELTYLSRLRTTEGAWFFFHRLGSEETIDIYEVLSIDGKHRFNIYMDLYHPRRSTKPIHGYKLDEQPNVWTGTPARLEQFPEGILEDLARQESGNGLGYAKPHQVIAALNDLLANYVPEFTGWRGKISEVEIQEAYELRGLIVPTPNDAIELENGLRWGWLPSKALAKRTGVALDEPYDPPTIILNEAIDAYLDLFPDNAGEFDIVPHKVFFDQAGPFAEYKVFGDLELAKDCVEFLTSYWAPKRNYFLNVTWCEIPSAFADDVGDEMTVEIRWLSDIDFDCRVLKSSSRQSKLTTLAPFSILRSGGLKRNIELDGYLCPLCNKPSSVWVTPDISNQVDEFNAGLSRKLPGQLTASEREILLFGTHPWCWPSESN